MKFTTDELHEFARTGRLPARNGVASMELAERENKQMSADVNVNVNPTEVREISVEEALNNILDRLGGLEEAINNLTSLADEIRERQEDLIVGVGELDRGSLGFSIES